MNNLLVAAVALLWIYFCDGELTHRGLLYPHMPNNRDQLGPYEDDESIQSNLILSQTFYGREEKTIWVNENGVLSYLDEFDLSSPLLFESLSTPLGPKLIAPFWADHGIVARNARAHIWYRETVENSGLLDRAKKDVQKAFSDATDFQPEALFIATFQRVKSFYGASDDLGNLRRKRDVSQNEKNKPVLAKQLCLECEGENSYQIVIINGGKGKDVYVMFNYHTIEWTMGYPGEVTQIGFNSGFGETFNLDLGDMTSLTELSCYTNVNKAGRFMFKVSGPDIIPAGPTVRVEA